MLKPHLEILPPAQRELWPALDAVPDQFVLYGGTGLALHIGHRASVDFDFFSSEGFDPSWLQSRLPFFKNLDPKNPELWIHRKRDNLEATINRGFGDVKVAFFGGLNTLKRVEDPVKLVESRVQVASKLDLAGMKMRVVQVRAHVRDYVDIHALAMNGVDVATGLAAAKAIDANFQPVPTLRALQFYGDGDLATDVPKAVQRDLTKWAQQVDLSKLPSIRHRGELSIGGLER